MFLAAADDFINIWRINIKDSTETIECECSYEYDNLRNSFIFFN